MGLDVRSYEHVELVRACPLSGISDDDYDEHDRAGHVLLYNMEEFAERGDGLPDGFYRGKGATLHWQASYGGYNRFRRDLCVAVLGVEPETVWNDYATYLDRPFAPLINFADNEGFLGPQTCSRLAADAEAVGMLDLADGWGQNPWPMWTKMFVSAAGTGVISFA